MTPAQSASFPTLLRNAHAAGLVALAPGHAPTLLAAATQLRFRAWQITLANAPDEAALMHLLGQQLGFPDWFGHNRDALADCLLDLSWSEAPGYLLLLNGFVGFAARAPEAAQALLDILADAASAWADDDIPFWVVFDGDAPAGLPMLAGTA